MLAVTLLSACDNNPLISKERKNNTEDKDDTKNKKDKEDRDDEDNKTDKKTKVDRDDEDDNTVDKKNKVDRDDADDETDKGDKGDNGYTTKDDDNNSGWTSRQRESYIGECVTEARKSVSASQATSYCDCMQNKIEKKYRMSFSKASRLTAEDLSTPEAKADIRDCLTNY